MPQASMDTACGLVDAFNRADWDRLGSLFATDGIYDEVGTGRQACGAREITDLFKGWKRAMPDSEGSVTGVLGDGETAVLEVTWTGTFTGPWATPEGDVEPTGKEQTTRACIITTLEDGQIKQCRQYYDSVALMRQFGLLPAGAAA